MALATKSHGCALLLLCAVVLVIRSITTKPVRARCWVIRARVTSCFSLRQLIGSHRPSGHSGLYNIRLAQLFKTHKYFTMKAVKPALLTTVARVVELRRDAGCA
jgi:hypothetical protein